MRVWNKRLRKRWSKTPDRGTALYSLFSWRSLRRVGLAQVPLAIAPQTFPFINFIKPRSGKPDQAARRKSLSFCNSFRCNPEHGF